MGSAQAPRKTGEARPTWLVVGRLWNVEVELSAAPPEAVALPSGL